MNGLVKDAVFSHCLHCSECGNLLQLKSGCAVAELAASHKHPRRTGNSVTYIQPCQNCIEIEVAPARALKAALLSI
jgi:hypothetical protein